MSIYYTHLPENMRRRPLTVKRERYAKLGGIDPCQIGRVLPRNFVDQLDRCADNMARRILISARWNSNGKRRLA